MEAILKLLIKMSYIILEHALTTLNMMVLVPALRQLFSVPEKDWGVG